MRKTHGTIIRTKEQQKVNVTETTWKIPHTQCGECQARNDRSPGKAKGAIYFGHRLEKEEGDSAIPSPQRQAVRDRSHSPNGEAVVMDTSQVVVGTSQKGGQAVGSQTIQPCGEQEKEG